MVLESGLRVPATDTPIIEAKPHSYITIHLAEVKDKLASDFGSSVPGYVFIRGCGSIE